MQEKRHYKLYKSGKQWVTCALTSVAILAGAAAVTVATPAAGQTPVHAAQVKVSKADLQKQLGWSTSYKVNDFNKAQYAKLQANIKAAKALLNSRRATPAQIKAIINALHNDGLAMIKASQDALAKQLDWSGAYDQQSASSANYNQLQNQIKQAKALIATGHATAAQLDAIRNNLHNTGAAIVKAAPAVAAANLEQQLKWSTAYSAEGLGADQYSALQAKIADAKALLASGKATPAQLRAIQDSLHVTGVQVVETKSVAASSVAASSAAASSAAASSAAASSAAASSAAASSAAASSAAASSAAASSAAASEAASQAPANPAPSAPVNNGGSNSNPTPITAHTLTYSTTFAGTGEGSAATAQSISLDSSNNVPASTTVTAPNGYRFDTTNEGTKTGVKVAISPDGLTATITGTATDNTALDLKLDKKIAVNYVKSDGTTSVSAGSATQEVWTAVDGSLASTQLTTLPSEFTAAATSEQSGVTVDPTSGDVTVNAAEAGSLPASITVKEA